MTWPWCNVSWSCSPRYMLVSAELTLWPMVPAPFHGCLLQDQVTPTRNTNTMVTWPAHEGHRGASACGSAELGDPGCHRPGVTALGSAVSIQHCLFQTTTLCRCNGLCCPCCGSSLRASQVFLGACLLQQHSSIKLRFDRNLSFRSSSSNCR